MDANRAATALLVDDDLASRQTNQQQLEGDGYVVVVARDEAEALSRAKQSAPNIIFVHLVATDRGSLPFMQALRSDDACRHIPIVVMRDQANFEMAMKQKKLRSVSRDRW